MSVKPKMLSFNSDTHQHERIMRQCAVVEKQMHAAGIKAKYTLSAYIRSAVDEKLLRDSKTKKQR